MRHTSTLKFDPNAQMIYLLLSMRPALWKRIALALYPLAIVALLVGVCIVGSDESQQTPLWIGFVILCLAILWPGIQLLWNVVGEEFLEISPQAIRWRYNYGIFNTNPVVKNIEIFQASYKYAHACDGIDYGNIQFFCLDENGFKKKLHETTIPIPKTEVLAFFDTLSALFREQNFLDFHAEAFLDN